MLPVKTTTSKAASSTKYATTTSGNRTSTYAASSYSGRITATANSTTGYIIPTSTSATLTPTATPSRVTNAGMANGAPAGIFAILGAAALAVMI